jgi:hypothetical protein
MTFAMLENLLPTVLPKELLSKGNFDKVNGVEIKKPEIAVSGVLVKTGESVDKPQLNGNHCTPILAEAPIFRKEIGVSMSDEGFIKLPRSLFNDPNWKGMREKYRRVFVVLLFHTSFTQRSFGIGANTITIGPGQFCTSIRNLVELCNDGIKYKDDKVDKNIVERAVSLFTKVGLVRQEVRHGKSILTITQRELYEHFQRQTETVSETRPRLDRDTNEERKEGKEIKETIVGANAIDSSLLNNEKEEQKKVPSVFTPKAQKQQIQLSEEKQKHYEFLWKFIVENSMNDGCTPNKKPGIKEKDLLNWLNVYEGKVILENLKTTLKAIPSSTWGGYMVSLFKKNVVAKKDNIQINNEFLEEIMKKHKCLHLENTKQYITDKVKHTDYQKNSDPKRFKEMIMASIAMANNYQDREHTHESEYEDDY